MKTIRVFPRKTSATPSDENVRFCMPGLFDEADQVKISVAFTWDMRHAEELYSQWKYVASTEIGGPATGSRGEDFTPGMFVKTGYVITSRGCNNRCWFCSVWRRDGNVRELPICDGWNILDDNLLACSDEHIKAVFAMLRRQKKRPAFTGGLEAKLLKDWHVVELWQLKPRSMFFAYDTPDDLEPLIRAGNMLQNAGFKPSNHQMCCYILMGYPKDTFELAEKRCIEAMKAGFLPFAMLWKNEKGDENKLWRRFQREWANHVITGHKMNEYLRNLRY